MAAPKPTPPTQAAIDSEIAANFAALGIANEATVPPAEAVLTAYSEFIAENKKVPTAGEIASRIGIGVSSVRDACRKLAAAGRMIAFRSKSGQTAYVPKVTP